MTLSIFKNCRLNLRNTLVPFIFLVGLLPPLFAAAVPLSDVQKRKYSKAHPSLFQVWNGLLDTSKTKEYRDKFANHYIAEHDLYMTGAWAFGLEADWPDTTNFGLATRYKASSIAKAKLKRDSLLALNPNLVFIGEVRYYDAEITYLPYDSPWWVRGPDGKPQKNRFCCEGLYEINWWNQDFRRHVASQAKSLLETGIFDGIFLDWMGNDRVDFINTIRDSIKDGIIYGNVNTSYHSEVTPLINGIFMEAIEMNTPDNWENARWVISESEKNLREPKLITMEVWGNKNFDGGKEKELRKLRATMTLMMTQSDGYALYYPDDLEAYYDHWHPYYEFYNIDIGSPTKAATWIDGGYMREFTRGTAVYNPPANNKTITVNFGKSMVRHSTGETNSSFSIPAYDGDIFVPANLYGTNAVKRARPNFSDITSTKPNFKADLPISLKSHQIILNGISIGTADPVNKLTVYTTAGKLLYSQTLPGTLQTESISTVSQRLPSGMVLVHLQTSSGSQFQKILLP